MAEAPPPKTPPTPEIPPGLFLQLSWKLFGPSWKTGWIAVLGVATIVATAVATIPPPITWQKLAPLLPQIVVAVGFYFTKDHDATGGTRSALKSPPPPG